MPMGTYFRGNSEIQGDGLQTLILMNPGYAGYPDTPQHQQHHQPPSANFVFPNNSTGGSSLNPNTLSHAPPIHHFVGIPTSATVSAAASQQDHPHHPSAVHSQHDISGFHGCMPRLQYSLYNPVNLTAAREVTRSQQGLSLSLSSQQPGDGSFRTENELPAPASAPTLAPTISPRSGGNDVRVPGGLSPSVSGVSNGVNGMQGVLLSSKYLKAAQELLDEVVTVGKGGKNSELAKASNGNTKNIAGGSLVQAAGEGLRGGGKTSSKCGAELTTAERQEIQMKKAKLLNMLDEVEQRYRQYHNKMQIVISWFEQVTGIGSAKTYTALALETISKQFRCLKDAILGQIRAASKSLGEEDSFGGGKIEGSRLKFVDNQLRQQRALQQLGMIQHNAWRPQRGLPEHSVSVLRAWLFEHFLHPYPNDSDKHMLAKQTGLSRSQVSNWFINARVRLWKPMVEEMYMEEIKEHEQNGSEDKTSKSDHNEELASKARAPVQEKSPSTENQDNPTSQNSHLNISVSIVSTSPTELNIRNHSDFTLIGSLEMEEMARGSLKKQRSTDMFRPEGNVSFMNIDSKPEANNEQVTMKFHNDQRQSRDSFTLVGSPTSYIRRFGSYPIGEIGRFGAEQFAAPYSGNGVSLTLGLPHGENPSMSEAHQTFLPNENIHMGREVDIGVANEFGAIDTPTLPHLLIQQTCSRT